MKTNNVAKKDQYHLCAKDDRKAKVKSKYLDEDREVEALKNGLPCSNLVINYKENKILPKGVPTFK